jgi:hypothetical protein
MMKNKAGNVWAAVSLAVLVVVTLAGCPAPAPEMGKVAVLLKSADTAVATQKADDNEVPRATIDALYITVQDIVLDQQTETGVVPVSLLAEPLQVDLLALQGIGAVLSSTTLPVGAYTGGSMVVSDAALAYVDAPDVLVPVLLPQDGAFTFAAEFEVVAGGEGVLKLHLDDVEVYAYDDGTLGFEAEFEFEAEVEGVENDDDDGDDDDGEAWLTAEAIEGLGKIEDIDLDDGTFEVKFGGSELDVDYAAAAILLPPAVEGGDAVPGTPADLVEDAQVYITGSLTLIDGDLVIIATTIEVVAWPAEDDEDNEDDDDDDDEDDDDDDGDDDEDEDEDEDEEDEDDDDD